VEHPLSSWQQSPARSYEQGKTNVISFEREDSFTIQFGSLEPIVVPLTAQISTVEINFALDDE